MDELTRQSIERVLRAGMAELTPVETLLVEALYFDETRAIKRHFREQHGIHGRQFDYRHSEVLEKLKACLCERGITHIWDVL